MLFRSQMGRNTEAYVDDIVVKVREERTLISDLEETFANLRKVNIKLNPNKCGFGVPSEPPLHRIPSRSSVSGLSPYKYLDSEREIDAGEDPTQGVSEYLD